MRLLRSTTTSTVEPVTTAGEPEPQKPAALARSSARIRRLSGLLAPTSPAPVYLGIAFIIAGFGILAYTWSRVAGTLLVALQIPYLISGGFTGLGLVVLGAVVIFLGAKRRDAWQRDRRLDELAALLGEAAGRSDEDVSD